VLSGFIEKDVDEVSRAYSARLGSASARGERNEWRSLVWTR
jgi:hypothetical protein